MFYDVIDKAEAAVAAYLEEHATQTSAKQLGLDGRAGHTLWATQDAVVTLDSNVRSLNYYGGFEYVDTDYVRQVGCYVIYFADDERVAACLQVLEDANQDA